MLFAITLFLTCLYLGETARSQRPNIIFIFADDMGWNDLSMHGSPQTPTPNIDALASSSLILHNYYGQPLCTPSRAALLTGLYPTRLGLEHLLQYAGEPQAIPLNVVLLPEHLKRLGYSTHMIGKWHVGYHKKEYTPTHRGFDTFFGYYNGYLDYYDYTHFDKAVNSWGIDLHNGTEVVREFRSRYSTEVFTDIGVDIIERHDKSQPLFLYMPYSAIHTGSHGNIEDLQAPPELIAKHRNVKDKKRRAFAGMISSLDDAVGRIFDTLYRNFMLENTIVVFSSDNGGEIDHGAVGSNWPLRGKKTELWEGGIRIPAFIWSPLLGLKEPRTSKQLMHLSDWLPTLYTAAGGNSRDLGRLDGYSMWNAWLHNSPSPRDLLLHNFDPLCGVSALRQGDYKLINGTATSGGKDWTQSVTGFEDGIRPASMDEYVFKRGSVVKNILQATGRWLPKKPDVWRANLTLHCRQPPPISNNGCDPKIAPCLFNIEEDPCEYNNLALIHPRIVELMMGKIKKYASEAASPQVFPFDPRSLPECHGFAHVPWLDEEYLSNCPYIYDTKDETSGTDGL